MRIPKGYTEDIVLEIILKVTKRYRGFAFDIYTGDDIEQEAFLIALDGLERYRSKNGPLENFLAVHVRNRLINFVEKHNNTKSEKFLVNHAIGLEQVDDQNESRMVTMETPVDDLIKAELIEELNNVIPVENRMDYIKMTRGVKVSKVRKDKVVKIIRDHMKNKLDK